MTYDYGDVGPLTNGTNATSINFTSTANTGPVSLLRFVASNDDYDLWDYELEGITVAVTELRAGHATRGHSHDDAETYFFQSDCTVRIGHKTFSVKKGQVLLVKPKEYHRVYALPKQTARFVAIFSGTREAKKASYGSK